MCFGSETFMLKVKKYCRVFELITNSIIERVPSLSLLIKEAELYESLAPNLENVYGVFLCYCDA